MKAFIIGGAGFIGSHLCDALLDRGDAVTVYDNLSVGSRWWVKPPAKLIEGDALHESDMQRSMLGHDVVFHLSANPEARAGLEDVRLDLHQGTMVTLNALEAAHKANVRRFVFASSGTVYGETGRACAEGDTGLPISLYGASKLAGEALVSAYCECFGMYGTILRFGNVVGRRATHGCILDFMRQLKTNDTYLRVLGDGSQRKPYLHVSDCVAGMVYASSIPSSSWPEVYNIAPEGNTSVAEIAKRCAGPNAWIDYVGGDRGWPGDVPESRMSGQRLARAGWMVRYSSDEAVAIAVEEIRAEVMR